jgi:hypothetical protein
VTKKIIFITSTGRSGSKILADILNSHKDVKCTHEFAELKTQSLGVKFLVNKIDESNLSKQLKKIYDPIINSNKKKKFIDCSDNIARYISVLKQLYPDSKFVHLFRDGRKVVSSFFYKLNKEIYSRKFYDETHKFFLNKRKKLPMNKSYWNNPPKNMNLTNFKKLSQFNKICMYWSDTNEKIIHEFKKLKSNDKFLLNFEKFSANNAFRKKFFKFLGINFNKEKLKEITKTLSRPHNVIIPKDYGLTKKQNNLFKKNCAKIFKKLNYNFKKKYNVIY